MADVTGGTPPTNASTFDVAGDLTDVYAHFGSQTMFSVATAASLPASGNWPGRELMTEDTDALYRHDGTSWARVSQPWTTFTASWSGWALGVGGSVLVSRYKIDNGECVVQYAGRLGTSGFSVNDPILTPPVSMSSVIEFDPSCIQATLTDDSAGAIGRYRAAGIAGPSTLRVQIAGTSGLLATITSVVPFTWATSDELHLYARYPVA